MANAKYREDEAAAREWLSRRRSDIAGLAALFMSSRLNEAYQLLVRLNIMPSCCDCGCQRGQYQPPSKCQLSHELQWETVRQSPGLRVPGFPHGFVHFACQAPFNLIVAMNRREDALSA